jgi:uncharacterized membrane protein
MVSSDGTFVFIGTYANEAAARADYDIIKDLHAVHAVGTFDAAVITKDAKGKVHINKDETATRHGAWGGAAAGALVGLIFPLGVVGAAAAGAAIGGVTGHLRKGVSRDAVREFGELIDSGEAALVVIGETILRDDFGQIELHPDKQVTKDLEIAGMDIGTAIDDATKDVS